MLKILLTAFIIFSSIGCSKPVVPPNIKVIPEVTRINVNALNGCIWLNPNDGKICGESAQKIYNTLYYLRKSEDYYRTEILIYKQNFVDNK